LSRIWFSHQDLLRIRFARRPAPIIELWTALATVQRSHERMFIDRRRYLRSRLDRATLPLFDLVAPTGAVPDFLAPVSGGLDDGLDAIRSTPLTVVRSQLVRSYSGTGKAPSRWLRDLADGDGESWGILVRALRGTYQRLADPRRASLLTGFYEDLGLRDELSTEHGIAAVLESIPCSRWTGRALENDDGCELPRKQIFLHDSGATFLPSTTWSGSPLLATTPDGSYLIVYASLSSHPDPPNGKAEGGLAAVVGRTRASVLQLLAQPKTTSGIARDLGISPASASEHAKVLRSAGLLITQREGPEVRHSCTNLGHRLAGR
jgi:DNA-binding transcriptional ArsR family regulator